MLETIDKPLHAGLLEKGMVGGLIDACNRLRADGVTDICLQERKVVLRRGVGGLVDEEARFGKYGLLSIVEMTLGKDVAERIADGGEANGDYCNLRISVTGMPGHGPVTVVLRLQ